jgi:general secretion pathway protein A
MFREYFGIEENPFSNTPDPSYLFLSERHQEALAHLQYGVEGTSGFVLLTGEVGTGKTTVSRCLVEQLPDTVDLAMCLNPRLTEAELLATICDEMAINRKKCAPDSVKDHMDALNRHLLKCHANGRRAVLIIDEAQNLSTSLLEQVRLLTNLETASTKLLQIILIGQPELRDTLARNDMRQLSQRITARYHLDPMTRTEADNYIRHRLTVGKLPPDLIQPAAMSVIFEYSGGIPRLINSICERCLLGAYATSTKTIGAALAHTAAGEVLGPTSPPKPAATGGDGPVVLNWAVAASVASAIVFGTVTLAQRDRDGTRAFAMSAPAPTSETAVKPAPIPVAAPKPPAGPSRSATKVNATDEALKVVSRLISGGLVTPPAKAAAPTPEAPPVTQAADPAVTFETLFQSPDLKAGLEDAVAGLFRLWGAEAQSLSSLNLCADAEAQGLRCYRGQGSWTKLVALNRPALISLGKTKGKRKYAVVTALNGPMATIEADGRQFVASTQIVQDLWPGDFLVLWKPQTSLRRNLRAGMSGRDVAWLRTHLGEILNVPPRPEKNKREDFFGGNLKSQVIAFQKSRGLTADGIVGTMTRIQLSAVIGSPNAPTLQKQP